MVSNIKVTTAQLLIAVAMYSSNLKAQNPVALAGGIVHPTVKIWETGDPDVVVYRIFFALRITNQGRTTVNVGSDPVLVLSVQHRQPDGTWANLNQSSWYDDGTVGYASCAPLGPEKTVTIPGVEADLSLLKSQLKIVGNRPVLRFQLQIQCKQPDGRIAGTPAFTTGPATIELSAAPNRTEHDK